MTTIPHELAARRPATVITGRSRPTPTGRRVRHPAPPDVPTGKVLIAFGIVFILAGLLGTALSLL